MEDLLASLALSLRASNRSPKTIHSYTLAVRQHAEFLGTDDVASVDKEDTETFISHCLQTKASATAAQRYRSLQQFYRWLEAESEVAPLPDGSIQNHRPSNESPVLSSPSSPVSHRKGRRKDQLSMSHLDRRTSEQ